MHGALQTADRTFLVILIGNRALVPFIQNWLCNTAHMDGVHERTLLLFTDDGHTALSSTGFRVASVGGVSANLTGGLRDSDDVKHGTVGYWRLAQVRVQVVASLLRGGIPLLLCEPDALWVRNPLDDPALHATSEMVYYSDSRETRSLAFVRLWPTDMIRSLFSAVEAEFSRWMPSAATEASASASMAMRSERLESVLPVRER